MKITLTLDNPPKGFSEKAEYRYPKSGEWVLGEDGAYMVGDPHCARIILTKLGSSDIV